jgi:hypothetical protein
MHDIYTLTVSHARYVYSKLLHMHDIYTLTVKHAQYVYSKQLHSANGYETRAAQGISCDQQ